MYLTGISALLLFIFWISVDPVTKLKANIPGQDKRPLVSPDAAPKINIGEKFTFIKTVTSSLTGKWPHFRGVDFDNINKESIPLIDHFSSKGAKIRWKILLGDGHASAAIYNGKVYVLDYNEAKKSDVLKCIALETGEELWRRSYKVSIKRNHGISRTIPAVNDKYVVSMGPKGTVMCVNSLTGELLWGIDLEHYYRTEIPFWNTGQCPFIDNDVAIIAPGGKSLLTGIDCKTGKILWETPNPDHWKMSHSSVMSMIFNGKKMYVYAALGGICGVSATGNDIGKVLWKTTAFTPNVFAPSPVILNNGRIFLTAGYGAGSAMIQLDNSSGGLQARLIQKYPPTGGLASEQQTPLFYKGFLYGILPRDAGGMHNQFVCVGTNDCSKILSTSGSDIRFGLGPYIIADGKFFILDDDGNLTIASVDNTKFRVLGKTKVFDAEDAWGPMAIADGMLVLRDSKNMLCLDIKKSDNE